MASIFPDSRILRNNCCKRFCKPLVGSFDKNLRLIYFHKQQRDKNRFVYFLVSRVGITTIAGLATLQFVTDMFKLITLLIIEMKENLSQI